MALNPADARPTGLSERERYNKIWTWYRANASRLASRTDDYAKRSSDCIRELSAPDSASAAQIADTFKHVQTGLLEWGYHESDGHYKMAAYAGA